MKGTADLTDLVRRTLVDRLQEWYGLDRGEITDDRPFAELGLTSRHAVSLAAELSTLVEVPLPATLLWEAPTIERLAQLVNGLNGTDTARNPLDTVDAKAAAGDADRPSGSALTPVAVIGVGCRLPGGVTSAAGFWELLTGGQDAVGTLPEGRWDGFADPGSEELREVSRHGAYLADVAGFDAEFFGIAPHEAVAMDPQQRLLLEVTRESLDHAAVPAGALAGTRTGVFVGISGNEYAQLTTAALGRVDAWTPPGAALSIAANRLSYALDLRGPSLAVDTACSSSLVAVHQAVRSLASGECDTALAGGVNVLLSPALTLAFQRAGATAADGRCKTFDAAADGMVRGEGCAVVVLKRLVDAERDGDRVLAVIRSTAVNSDGRSNGLLAPNAEAQRALLEQAHLEQGPVAPADVDYVEAHGTGTALGDPIEAGALGAVLGRGRDPEQPLLVGSVKTNLGHLEAAAGVTGLVKTVLALHHGEIPAQLHFTEPSPHIDFDGLALRVVADPEPWPRYSGTATAGVSAFGFGGTNAHVVLQEHRPLPRRGRPEGGARGAAGRQPARTPVVALLDAPAEDRLREDAGDLARWLASPRARAARAEDVARTLAGRTGKGRHRAAVVASGTAELADAWAHLAEGRPHPNVITGDGRGTRGGPGPVWVFSGYGSQWPGMARGLLETEPVFAEALDALEPLVLAHAGLSLRAHLRPDAELAVPSVVQPVLFGVQVALAELWRAYGFRPGAVIGHSMGEVAAAVVAGAIDAETGARIIAVRSRLLDGLSGGAMAVVERPAEWIRALSARLPSLQVAVHASPVQSVVTGSAADIDALIAQVSEEGGLARSLHVVAAGHSPAIDPLLGPVTKELGSVPYAAPGCRFYTTVLDSPYDARHFDVGYWAANLRRPVRFTQAVAAAAQDGHRVFVEVSPHPTQLHPLTETLRAAGVDDALVLPTLRRGADDAVAFRSSLASLLVHGAAAPPRDLHPDGRVVDLPGPRWRHTRYWAADGAAAPRYAAPAAPRAAEAPDPAGGARESGPLTTVDRLRAVVAEVMGYRPDRIDPDTPLTELGLDSLMAARILAAVQAEFGTAIEPRVLLRHGTVSAVVALLDGREAGPGERAASAGGVLPRDAAERLVAHAWEAVTGAPPSGVEDDLGLAGRDPEFLERFAAVLGERAGQQVAVADLTGGPGTVAGIAAVVRPGLEEPVSGPLRTLRAEGSRPPLFLIHPAGGSAAVYRGLADRLGADQPVVGLERLPELTEVSERAAAYARLVREASPAGPWAVGGWSYGGVVAQETARLLAGHGTVTSLVLVDSVLPLPAPELSPLEEVRRRFAAFAEYVERTYGSPLPIPYEQLAALADAEQIELVIKALEHAVDLPPAVLEHQRTSYLDLRSGERHTPRPYGGRTLLYRATEAAPHTVRDTRYERDDAALGWDAYCPDLTVAPLPGHHLSLLDPPVVDLLAELLVRDLAAG
ncbi:beta-ketoacyl synthase N-terminal-like domain-containing protein [Streptomyces sp. B1866]|uniref:beta-ketoacyl synthase N-terminal-like domain-containing protein n=1 Tax=Streptomyces sp. B1866 TaxID=3075431 RepID=UPI00288E740F|nr:beta-ketoacyl synthase N-terminal-like domain-containing protein [Streptomyces sp. B1866]MDT3396041.1 beta-ketoacyl synthase N-terminal-like domain-containing protein [Streptomyces sp. B1866]